MYECKALSFILDGQTHIYSSDFVLERNKFNVMLGSALSGKTTLLRLIAGLIKPTTGEIYKNGTNITRLSVKHRNIAFVYQQFINYPNMTVAENISSPMHAEKRTRSEITKEVNKIAELLKIKPFLNRYPHELSGGQQQRTAIGRALAKSSEIILFDEPLVNLDYKLREELRDELPKLLLKTGRVIVYTTAEPQEALLLKGNLLVLHKGLLCDSGETSRIFYEPSNLKAARAFSYPPLNTLQAVFKGGILRSASGMTIQLPSGYCLSEGETYTLGIRAYRVKTGEKGIPPGELSINATVLFSELAGSDSYVHFLFHGKNWVMHDHRLIDYKPGDSLNVYILKTDWMVFDTSGNFVKREEI